MGVGLQAGSSRLVGAGLEGLFLGCSLKAGLRGLGGFGVQVRVLGDGF